MNNKKYVFNPNTLRYEKQRLSIKERFVKYGGYGSALVITSLLIAIGIYSFFPTPKEKSQDRHITQLQYSYDNVSTDLQEIAEDLEALQQKDADVHRMILGMDPIDESIWEGGTGGSNKYDYLESYANSGDLMESSMKHVEKLKYKLELQKKSLDTIYSLAFVHKEKLASIPSIKPIQEDKLKRRIRWLSGYGMRIHPIHKIKKFHAGMDFTAPKGTPIQSTGNGKIKKVSKSKRGYGHSVTIDHGFGYETLYAHMDEIHVKKGQKVTKGQQIGTVGSTGTSTAPHCHYEVRKNGKTVNPIDYVMDGLSSKEYQDLVERASVENQFFH